MYPFFIKKEKNPMKNGMKWEIEMVFLKCAIIAAQGVKFMIQTTTQTIAHALHTSLFGCDDSDISIAGISIDSRRVQPGNLYIPLIGQRVDGHTFLDSAKQHGATAAFWQIDHKPYPDFPLILVSDTTVALQDLARYYMKTLSCTVIGVTGSNGKTSCKDILYSVFSQKYKTQKTQGNHNNEIGLPLTVLDLDADVEIAILEMGMEHKGDIDFLCSIAQPDLSIITSIGSAHMENFGTKENIARGKLEILTHTKSLCLYHTCPEIKAVLPEIDRGDVMLHSFGPGGNSYIMGDIIHRKDGITFTCNDMKKPVSMNVLGDFQAENALPVIYAAKTKQIDENAIEYGLEHIEMTKMRTQQITIGQATIIDDSYKSNPESAKVALDTLSSIPTPCHIAVLSDMLDLGENEKALHAQIGAYAHQLGIDYVFCVGDRSFYTADAAQGTWFDSKKSLMQALRPFLNTDCAILVKGSRAMAMDQIISDLQQGENE